MNDTDRYSPNRMPSVTQPGGNELSNAEDALKAANAEILAPHLQGHIRDLEAEWTEDAIQRVTTENTTLKQRLCNSPPTTAPRTSG